MRKISRFQHKYRTVSNIYTSESGRRLSEISSRTREIDCYMQLRKVTRSKVTTTYFIKNNVFFPRYYRTNLKWPSLFVRTSIFEID